jgi:hypothetical protein
MFIPIIRILFCLTLCLGLLSFWGCLEPPTECEYQNVVAIRAGTDIDSIAVKIDNSLVGCKTRHSIGIGSRTHSIGLPGEMHIQLFSEGVLLWEDFSFEIPKNKILTFHRGTECEGNATIIPSQAENYCWTIEEINDGARCIEWKYELDDEILPCDDRWL